jgi:hypothetical protein
MFMIEEGVASEQQTSCMLLVLIFESETGSGMFFRNVGEVPEYTASHRLAVRACSLATEGVAVHRESAPVPRVGSSVRVHVWGAPMCTGSLLCDVTAAQRI